MAQRQQHSFHKRAYRGFESHSWHQMKIRVKMRMLPGDINKSEKIRLLESPEPDEVKRAKSLKKLYRMRERAAFRERTRIEIERDAE